jgi:hypothetical protein
MPVFERMKQQTQRYYQQHSVTPPPHEVHADGDLGQGGDPRVEAGFDREMAKAQRPPPAEDDAEPLATTGTRNRDGPVSALARVRRMSTAYYDYWISVFDKARNMPEQKASAMHIKSALQTAAGPLKPGATDAAMFTAAGGTELPYRAVAIWLRMRRAIGNDAGIVHRDAARFWERQLATAPDHSSREWSEKLAGYIETAARQDNGAAALSEQNYQGFRQHPEWALAYVRCGAYKARLAAAMSVQDDQAGGSKHADTRDIDSGIAPDAVQRPPVNAAAPPSAYLPSKAYHGTEHGTHLALAGSLGSLLASPLVLAGSAHRIRASVGAVSGTGAGVAGAAGAGQAMATGAAGSGAPARRRSARAPGGDGGDRASAQAAA